MNLFLAKKKANFFEIVGRGVCRPRAHKKNQKNNKKCKKMAKFGKEKTEELHTSNIKLRKN